MQYMSNTVICGIGVVLNDCFPLLLAVRQHDQTCGYSSRGTAGRHSHSLGKGKVLHTVLTVQSQSCRGCTKKTYL